MEKDTLPSNSNAKLGSAGSNFRSGNACSSKKLTFAAFWRRAAIVLVVLGACWILWGLTRCAPPYSCHSGLAVAELLFPHREIEQEIFGRACGLSCFCEAVANHLRASQNGQSTNKRCTEAGHISPRSAGKLLLLPCWLLGIWLILPLLLLKILSRASLQTRCLAHRQRDRQMGQGQPSRPVSLLSLAPLCSPSFFLSVLCIITTSKPFHDSPDGHSSPCLLYLSRPPFVSCNSSNSRCIH